MIVSPAFAGRKYAILGLARSGLAAAESLLASGAQVLAWDRQDVARAHLQGRAILADPMEADLTGYDGIVVSPGVRSPAIAAAFPSTLVNSGAPPVSILRTPVSDGVDADDARGAGLCLVGTPSPWSPSGRIGG